MQVESQGLRGRCKVGLTLDHYSKYQKWREGLSSEEQMLHLCFQTLCPPVSGFPTVVCHDVNSALAAVARITNCELGLYGESIPFDGDGNSLFEDAYSSSQPFEYWATSKNQAELFRLWPQRNLPKFRLCVDSTVDLSLFDEPWINKALTSPTTFELINRLPRIIEKIGWAYCQISDDFRLSMFLCSEKHRELAEMYRNWCSQESVPHATIVAESACKARWHDFESGGIANSRDCKEFLV